MSLDLGCGDRRLPGFVRVDWNPKYMPDYCFNVETDIYPFKSDSFDLVICDHVFEHLREINHLLYETLRIMKNGGRFRFSFPHYSVSSIESDHRGRWGLHALSFFPEFVVTNVNVEWSPNRGKNRVYSFVNQVLSCLARSNPFFCERVWCYLVGGFSNVVLQGVVRK